MNLLNSKIINDLPFQKNRETQVEEKVEEKRVTSREQDSRKVNQVLKENKLPELVVYQSEISLFSYEQMKKVSNGIEVKNNLKVDMGSLNDPRMGIVNNKIPCQYCQLLDCQGHYGLLDFKLNYVYNPETLNELIAVLTSICISCGGLILDKDLLELEGILKYSGNAILKYIKEKSKTTNCSRRYKNNKIIECQKNPTFTLKSKDSDDKKGGKREGIIHIIKKNSGVEIPMPIEEVKKILDNISDEDSEYLGFSNKSHPRNFIFESLLVIPPISRPPNLVEGVEKNNDLTEIYTQIVQTLDKHIKFNSEDSYRNLFQKIEFLFDGGDSTTKKGMTKEFKSIIGIIQSKKGLMRTGLMGKRIDYGSRSVSGPESDIAFGYFGYPKQWSSIMTKPCKVSRINYDYVMNLYKQGKIKKIIEAETKIVKAINRNNNYIIKIGDTVERFLENDDFQVVNRQPSLHKHSLMSQKTVLRPQLTIGLVLSVTQPYNADFDGDENNVYCPQSLEVEAEMKYLLNVKYNIMSPEQNKPMMGLVMNSVTGSYLLTKDDIIVNEKLFFYLSTFIKDKNRLMTLSRRLKKHNIKPFSGKSLFSILLPQDFYYNNKIKKDNDILIINGILTKGRIQKDHIGNKERSIIQELHGKYGPKVTSDFITECNFVINGWIMEHGFSVGILDVVKFEKDNETGERFKNKNEEILKEKLVEINIDLESLGGKLKDDIAEKQRITKIKGIVNVAEGVGKKLIEESFTNDNSIIMMTESGAKGSIENVAQIMGFVGQQNYHGNRLQPTITNNKRLLPTFDPLSNTAEANGFIRNSFYSGLTPEELFFLQAGGREGLMDTNLKTAETGHINRQMIKAFENIVIGYDGSIRNTSGTLFSVINNLGFDVTSMINKDGITTFIDIDNVMDELNNEIDYNDVEEFDNSEFKDQLIHFDNNFEKEEEEVIDKKNNFVINEIPKRTSFKITKYEKSRIIGIRAKQLSDNAKPIIDIDDEVDYIRIASKEYKTGKLNIKIIRRYPNKDIDIIYPTLENI